MEATRTNVRAIPEKRPREVAAFHHAEQVETTDAVDELELKCILCRERIPPKRLCLYWHRTGAVAHFDCYSQLPVAQAVRP